MELISDANAGLSLNSKKIRRLSKKTISKIKISSANRRIQEAGEAQVKLANKKLVYVSSYGARLSASEAVRFLATQSSESGRKVVICDTAGMTDKEIKDKPSQNISGLPIVDLDNNISMMIGLNEASFFTSSNFNSTINNLLTNFDQVFVCSSKNNASVGLLAFQEFDFSLVLSAGLRTTQKLAIRKIKENKPIDLLFYD